MTLPDGLVLVDVVRMEMGRTDSSGTSDGTERASSAVS